jgi:hypothetical protein
MTEEIKQNPYAGTPLARRTDENLGMFDRLIAKHLVTLTQPTQSAILAASGAIAAYSNYEFAGKAAEFVPVIGMVVNQIDASLAGAAAESFRASMALKIARRSLKGMRVCDVQKGGW